MCACADESPHPILCQNWETQIPKKFGWGARTKDYTKDMPSSITESLSRSRLETLSTQLEGEVALIESNIDHLYEQIGVHGLQVVLAVDAAERFIEANQA